MRPTRFVLENQETWERLSSLLEKAEREGLGSLSPAQLDELGRKYRRVAAHLSMARSTHADPAVIDYLNELAARAYARIYAGGPRRSRALRRLFAAEMPQTFRRRAPYIALSVGLSLLAAAAAFVAVSSDPRWAPTLLNEANVASWQEFAKSGSRAGEYFASAAETLGGAGFASFLMSNNIQVALRAFAFGIAFGLGTVFVLVTNGVMLGTFFGVGSNAGHSMLFTSVIAPHGFLELSAIFIAGGAGLLIGHALVDPGDMYRRDALRLAAADAVKLVIGTVPMFIVAGIIEAIVSPQSGGLFAADPARVIFGLAVAIAFWLYLLFGDRLWGDESYSPAP